MSSVAPESPLGRLAVFEKLSVGPVRLTPSKLTAPYRLFHDGREDRFELVYRFEEDVFEPESPSSENLAGMIAAQAALNYGLFCKVIEFHGKYDETDRRFIRAMAENTAREIYVKKIIEPNPFLTGALGGLKPVKLPRYLVAAIRFPSKDFRAHRSRWDRWPTDPDRVCVLSSGGKESLLSYGLLNEVAGGSLDSPAGTIHPVFINESGHHWFTALNGHRYFKASVPTTTRVWVNSDRLFNWMLRRMPFIRPDFAAMRADMYPIRLWTVAVFLFGALPIVQKRKIGRLVIGDEFDTSVRESTAGIRHYDGLFDQSIWFDGALSRYFFQKGWAVSQFSILRPLSEILVLKTLVERYPELQRHQVSCHAAHKEGERVRPCGRCEKCRRVVGMLLAIDADPGNCGYSPEQVRACLESLEHLTKNDVHQESASAEQLFHMLAEKGHLKSPPGGAAANPEIFNLRFDRERSPVFAIPLNLRRPLYRIFIESIGGALRRVGRKWEPFDLLTDPAMDQPYPFEPDALSPARGGSLESPVSPSAGPTSFMWGEMTWPEAEERFVGTDIALLPVGALEQHGPHLPLDTDAFDADHLSRRVADACSDPKPLVLPLVPYGVSYHHDDFKGTVGIGNETLSHLVYDIGMSVARNGIKKLLIINGHGGNGPALNQAAQMINRDAKIFVCVDSGETSDVDVDGLVDTPNDVHAGEIETSTSLAVRPHLVRGNRIVREIPEFSSRYLNFTSRRSVSWYAHTRRISDTGVMGDPTRASAGKGRAIWALMVTHLVALVEDLKGIPLTDIYQQRY
jgi:creatinine amidohydrolase/Fe(II)-dependent formamide hydrolase-like protein